MSCPFHRALAEPEAASGNGAEQPAVPIPQPPPSYFLGNIADIDPTFISRSFWNLEKIYGPIYKLDLPGRTTIVVSSHELIDEICDEDRFEKTIAGPLKQVRAVVGDGLFTSYQDEPVRAL